MHSVRRRPLISLRSILHQGFDVSGPLRGEGWLTQFGPTSGPKATPGRLQVACGDQKRPSPIGQGREAGCFDSAIRFMVVFAGTATGPPACQRPRSTTGPPDRRRPGLAPPLGDQGLALPAFRTPMAAPAPWGWQGRPAASGRGRIELTLKEQPPHPNPPRRPRAAMAKLRGPAAIAAAAPC